MSRAECVETDVTELRDYHGVFKISSEGIACSREGGSLRRVYARPSRRRWRLSPLEQDPASGRPMRLDRRERRRYEVTLMVDSCLNSQPTSARRAPTGC
jgi:hypothetical protein